MLPIKHILAPVDFSERSEAAAVDAAGLSELFGAKLTLLHVAPTIQTPQTYRSPAQIERSEKTQLESSHLLETQLQVLAARIAPDALSVVVEGDPAACIEKYVQVHDVDLLVMATHGLGVFRRYLLGSLAAKMLHDLDIPIATGVHLETESAFPTNFTNIGCAVDLRDKEDAERILRWSSELAELVGAKLTLIHVPQNVDYGQLFAAQARDAVLDRAAQDIAGLLEKTELAADVVIECGDPMKTVAKHLERKECDVLVIGRTSHKSAFPVGHADGYALIRQVAVPVFSV